MVSIFLRPVAIFAGIIGVIQGMTWFAFAIVGISAYFCTMTIDIAGLKSHTSYQSAVLFLTYFRGQTCAGDVGDFTWNNLPPVTRPDTVMAWMWVYMASSFIWFISSVCIIIKVKEDNLRQANSYLFVWIFTTVLISIFDFTLGIMFGIDYGTDMTGNTLFKQFGPYFHVSAAIMFVMALRGFVLWLINVACAGFLFICTFSIYREAKSSAWTDRRVQEYSYPSNSFQNGYGSRHPATEEVKPPRDFRSDYPRNDPRESARDPRDNRWDTSPRDRRSRSFNFGQATQVLPRSNGASNPRPDYSPTLPRINPKPTLKRPESHYNGAFRY